MSKTQSIDKSVDRSGYVLVTPADGCERRSADIDVPASGAKKAIRNGVLRKRSRLFIQHHDNGIGSLSLHIGGNGVTTANGYPLKEGETIELPVTPKVLVFGRVAAGPASSDVRTLETG